MGKFPRASNNISSKIKNFNIIDEARWRNLPCLFQPRRVFLFLCGFTFLTVVILVVSMLKKSASTSKPVPLNVTVAKEEPLKVGIDRRYFNITDGYINTGTIKFIWRKHEPERLEPKGIILLLHSCKEQSTVWFSETENCKECYGMPSEVRLSNYFHSQGFVSLAISPTVYNDKSKCWHGNDRFHIAEAVEYVYKSLRLSLKSTPLYAVANSNGGSFLLNSINLFKDRFHIKFTAIALMNVGLWHDNQRGHSGFPSTLFICQSRNAELCVNNDLRVGKLLSKQIKAKQIVYDPIPLSRDIFSCNGVPIRGGDKCSIQNKCLGQGHEHCLSSKESFQLYDLMKKKGYIWPKSSLLLYDPVRIKSKLREYLAKELPDIYYKDDLREERSPILQLLRIAWGGKEMTFESAPNITEWFTG